MEEFVKEVEASLSNHQDIEPLFSIAKELRDEMVQHCKIASQCMLPSCIYDLPTGRETGTYLAVEIGGSNLRVAVVNLHLTSQQDAESPISIQCMEVVPIDDVIKKSEGHAVFDWIASKIQQLLIGHAVSVRSDEPWPMGLAWSFPIEQTSMQDGKILEMGKQFACSNALKGKDLGSMIISACQRTSLNIQLMAIVNDTAAALLAQAYTEPTTRLAAVLGTGMNAAVYLPSSALSPRKFVERKPPPMELVKQIVINTELSMFGKNSLPRTRWDDMLNEKHTLPDYQPFEYLTSGGYLGEIVRLIIEEAVQKYGTDASGPDLGQLHAPYSLSTRTLGEYENGSTSILPSYFSLAFHTKKVSSELDQAPQFLSPTQIRRIIRAVTTRSATYFAIGLHALTSLLGDEATQTNRDISIACDGSVINEYPLYMARVQTILDDLTEFERRQQHERDQQTANILLKKTQNAAVIGAAVAAAMTKDSIHIKSQWTY